MASKPSICLIVNIKTALIIMFALLHVTNGLIKLWNNSEIKILKTNIEYFPLFFFALIFAYLQSSVMLFSYTFQSDVKEKKVPVTKPNVAFMLLTRIFTPSRSISYLKFQLIFIILRWFSFTKNNTMCLSLIQPCF